MGFIVAAYCVASTLLLVLWLRARHDAREWQRNADLYRAEYQQIRHRLLQAMNAEKIALEGESIMRERANEMQAALFRMQGDWKSADGRWLMIDLGVSGQSKDRAH